MFGFFSIFSFFLNELKDDSNESERDRVKFFAEKKIR